MPVALPDLVGALVPLTGLVELRFGLCCQPAVVPAALGQLKGLRLLEIWLCDPCVLEAGCLDLPSLQVLDLQGCVIEHAAGLPGFSAIQRLTRICFSGGQGALVFAQLVHLPVLQHIEYSWPRHGGLQVSRLPSDVGALSSTLRVLHICDNGLTQFPLVLTQLRALVCLTAKCNHIAELPAAFTALSRLTSLLLGRYPIGDLLPFRETPPLDVRALGDLSGFPALRELSFADCEVVLCGSVLGAVRHASLTSLSFKDAYPAPMCEGAVLQLGQALAQVNRGGVLKVTAELLIP